MNHDLLRLADTETSEITPAADRDTLLSAMDRVKAAKEAVAVLSERMEQAAIEWIKANGDLESGGVRYYVAPNKTTKCLSLSNTLKALLDATGGDFDATVACLSTSAFKPGACRDVLPVNTYGELFQTTEVMDIKEGKPKAPRLQRLDPKFVKGAAQ